MYVIPTGAGPVPNPERGGELPLEGAFVPETQYWNKQLASGYIVKAEPPTEPAAAPSPVARRAKSE